MSRRAAGSAPWNGLNIVKRGASWRPTVSLQCFYSMLAYARTFTKTKHQTCRFEFTETKVVKQMKCPVLPRVDSTDHAAFVTKRELNEHEKQVAGCLLVFCLNLLMQQRAREVKDQLTGQTKTVFNNGWERTNETDAEYEARLERQIEEIISAIKHEKIPQEQPFCVFFQESPIKAEQQKRICERFQQAFPNLTLAGATEFGVMTLTTGSYQRVDALAAKLGKLAIRCESFAINENHIITNIHTPHANNPADQKENFKQILRPILESLTCGDITKPRWHDVIGDKNLSPAAVREAVHEIYDEIKDKTQTPFSLEVLYESSPNGHVKDGGKKIVSVDGALSLRVKRADHESSFTFNVMKNKLRYAVGLMAAAVTYVGEAIVNALLTTADDMTALESRLLVTGGITAGTTREKIMITAFHALRSV